VTAVVLTRAQLVDLVARGLEYAENYAAANELRRAMTDLDAASADGTLQVVVSERDLADLVGAVVRAS